MGPAIEEWISDDDQSIDPRVHEGSKGHVDLRFGAGVRELETQPEDARSLLRLSRARYRIRILLVHETAYQRCLGQHLVQCFELLCPHAAEYGAYACRVAARSIDACDEAKVDWVAGDREDDGNGCACRLGGERSDGATDGDNDSRLAASQLRCERRQSIVLLVRPREVAHHVTAFDVTGFAQAAPKLDQAPNVGLLGPAAEKADHGHRRLLRARREGPRGRAAEQRDEVPSFHSITSSARSRNASGIVRPSALAVVKLMARSNLVGCSTGISPGFAPRRILSTELAARRNCSEKLGP